MSDWLLPFLCCQSCGATLEISDNLESDAGGLVTGTLECPDCELLWPVLAGVPLMLSEPGMYLAQYRESVITTLAEYGSASQEALHLIYDFCQGHSVEALRYSDDWTEEERTGEPAKQGLANTDFLALIKQDREQGLHASVEKLLEGRKVDTIAEVGPGCGGLSGVLAKSCQRLLLIDFSLRSLLLSKSRISDGHEVAMVLAEAGSLEMMSDSFSVIVAANVVDILDDAEHFLESSSRWLKSGGRLIVTTPDPALGTDNEQCLQEMLLALEYKVDKVQEGIPWLRVHGPRYCQVYWLQALCASI